MSSLPRPQRERRVFFDSTDFSLVDALSFAVMERLQVPAAFAFDQHFAQYGLTVLNLDYF